MIASRCCYCIIILQKNTKKPLRFYLLRDMRGAKLLLTRSRATVCAFGLAPFCLSAVLKFDSSDGIGFRVEGFC